MERLLRQILCFSLALLFTRCALWAQDTETKIDQYMQAAVHVDHFMGTVLVAQRGRVIFSRGYGMANVKRGLPNTPQTEFRIGSITKEFTAMAILELQARGKLSVQDPVCKYVPECPKDWAPIKIFNLLTHTSGIPNFTSFPNYLKIETQSLTPTELLADFENKPLDFKPGAKFSYSNSGYEVLGYIIERVSGETYQAFLEKNIFKPLGMTDSGYDNSHPTASNHAVGYFYSNASYTPSRYVNMTVPFSAGALYSTALDLYKWDRALEAGKLIPKGLLDAMLTPHVAMGGPGNAHYGFGWVISTEFGHKGISHGGGIEGFTSMNSWFPADHAYAIALDNVTSPEIGAVSRALTAILFGQKYEIPREYKAIALSGDELQKFVGQYQLAPKFIITVRRTGDQLNAQATGQPSAPIFPESGTEFFYKVVDAQLSFVQNSSGQVTGLVLHQGGRDVPAKKISSEVPSLPPVRKAISLPASVLQKYVGRYQLTPGFAMTITLAGDQLAEQATGQPAFPIFPESRSEFFLKVVDAQITFAENSEGQVTGLVLHQNGRDLPGKKII
jgi:CubicO group peptidase (beta-lactamase class C family)